MSKVPTAEEFEKKYEEELDYLLDNPTIPRYSILQKLFKEFARLHVKAAVKECIESAPYGSSTDTVSYEDVVEALKDCYPESNIK